MSSYFHHNYMPNSVSWIPGKRHPSLLLCTESCLLHRTSPPPSQPTPRKEKRKREVRGFEIHGKTVRGFAIHGKAWTVLELPVPDQTPACHQPYPQVPTMHSRCVSMKPKDILMIVICEEPTVILVYQGPFQVLKSLMMHACKPFQVLCSLMTDWQTETYACMHALIISPSFMH